MFVLGIDEATGALLHDTLVFENEQVEPLGGSQGYNNYAAPSCVLAPGAVFVHFGSYGTARLDADTAQIVWQRRDLPCRHFRGPGSSPVLCGDKLILTFDGVDQQYTAVLDARTGETLWRTDRSTNYGDLDENGLPRGDGDYRKAYCTPGIATIGDRVQILSTGSRAMHSYDLLTGRELWTLRHKEYNAAIRPLWLPEEGLALINTGSRAAHFLAVKLDASTTGDITETHVVWNRERGNPRFAKPIYWKGLIFQITDLGAASCIDAVSGEEIWKDRVPGDYRSSPFLAGDHLYFFSEDGRGTVVRAGRTFQEIAVNEVPGMGTTACPAVSQGAIFVRGKTQLYKIRE
jgi:outer membrane protein assembly factor BamB